MQAAARQLDRLVRALGAAVTADRVRLAAALRAARRERERAASLRGDALGTLASQSPTGFDLCAEAAWQAALLAQAHTALEAARRQDSAANAARLALVHTLARERAVVGLLEKAHLSERRARERAADDQPVSRSGSAGPSSAGIA